MLSSLSDDEIHIAKALLLIVRKNYFNFILLFVVVAVPTTEDGYNLESPYTLGQTQAS